MEAYSVFQNPIDLFTNLKDGNRNKKEVLKNQTNFKSDLGKKKTKKNPNSRSEEQISLIQNVEFFFD